MKNLFNQIVKVSSQYPLILQLLTGDESSDKEVLQFAEGEIAASKAAADKKVADSAGASGGQGADEQTHETAAARKKQLEAEKAAKKATKEARAKADAKR